MIKIIKIKLKNLKKQSSFFIRLKFNYSTKNQQIIESKKENVKQNGIDEITNEINDLISAFPLEVQDIYIDKYNRIVSKYSDDEKNEEKHILSNEISLGFDRYGTLLLELSQLKSTLISLQVYENLKQYIKEFDPVFKQCESYKQIDNPKSLSDMINNILFKAQLVDYDYYEKVKNNIISIFSRTLQKCKNSTFNESKITLDLYSDDYKKQIYDCIEIEENKVNELFNKYGKHIELLNLLQSCDMTQNTNIKSLEDNIYTLNYLFSSTNEYKNKILYDMIKRRYVKILKNIIFDSKQDDIILVKRNLSNELLLLVNKINNENDVITNEKNNLIQISNYNKRIRNGVIKLFIDEINSEFANVNSLSKDELLKHANDLVAKIKQNSYILKDIKEEQKANQEIYKALAGILLNASIMKKYENDKIITKRLKRTKE